MNYLASIDLNFVTFVSVIPICQILDWFLRFGRLTKIENYLIIPLIDLANMLLNKRTGKLFLDFVSKDKY